jgi:hypothetical protein
MFLRKIIPEKEHVALNYFIKKECNGELFTNMNVFLSENTLY